MTRDWPPLMSTALASACMCEFPDECSGTGVLHCDGCGGDLCVCRCGGGLPCGGCGYCDSLNEDNVDGEWQP